MSSSRNYYQCKRLRDRRRYRGAIIFRVPEFFAHPKVPSLWAHRRVAATRRDSPVALSVQLWVLISREKERNDGRKAGKKRSCWTSSRGGRTKRRWRPSMRWENNNKVEMSEPVHKLLRSLLMVWGPEATSAKRGPVWPGFDYVFLFYSLVLSHSSHLTPLQLGLSLFLGLGPGRRGSGPTRSRRLFSLSLFLLEGSFLYLMDVQRCSPSILNLWILESQKEGLKGSGGHKGYTSMVGTACDWRPGVALPTDRAPL